MMSRAPQEGWPEIDDAFAHDIVTASMRRYFAERRARIPSFVDRHFSFSGSAELHRKALGWDLVRAPTNLVLAIPNIAAKLGAAGLRRAGATRAAARLRDRRLLLQTDVAREIEWLVMTELLELPCQAGGRASQGDALLEAVMTDARVEALTVKVLAAIGKHRGDAEFRSRLEAALGAYTDTRVAAADIASALTLLGVGAVGTHQLTPGAVTLGMAVAAAMAQQSAIASFPLGSTLGGLWYGVFPAAPSTALVAGVTGGLTLGVAALSAFAGMVTDPIQRHIGLHRRRLERLIDALERQWIGGSEGVFVVRDHYAARLLDVLDLLATAWRLAR